MLIRSVIAKLKTLLAELKYFSLLVKLKNLCNLYIAFIENPAWPSPSKTKTTFRLLMCVVLMAECNACQTIFKLHTRQPTDRLITLSPVQHIPCRHFDIPRLIAVAFQLLNYLSTFPDFVKCVRPELDICQPFIALIHIWFQKSVLSS